MCFQEVLLGIIGIFLPPSMKRKTRISSHLRSLACIAAALNSISRRFFSPKRFLWNAKTTMTLLPPLIPKGSNFQRRRRMG